MAGIPAAGPLAGLSPTTSSACWEAAAKVALAVALNDESERNKERRREQCAVCDVLMLLETARAG